MTCMQFLYSSVVKLFNFTGRTIMTHSIRCHFSFPATISGKPVKLKVIEEMAESGFNIQVPIELL